jgi:hypothetical protein
VLAEQPPELLCSGRNDNAPVFVHRDADGSLQRLNATTQKDGTYTIRYTQIPAAEIQAMCASGLSLAVMFKPKPTSSLSADGEKISTLTYLPSSFLITGWQYGGYNGVDGGVWVPGTMPSSHNAHITQFDVVENGFYNAINGAHLVHMVTASTAASIETEYQGKGMIFGPYGHFCGAGSAGASAPGGGSYGAISETYMYPTPTPPASNYYNVNRSKIWAGNDPSRDSFAATATPYHTCFQQQQGASVKYLVGANRSQGSVYYTKPSASPTWSITPSITSTSQYFRTGYAGVAFFVASGGPAGVWSLQFTNVSSVTQP